MNIKAEINWIQAELAGVRDPYLILAFKNLLKYRKKQSSSLNIKLQEKLTNRALKSELDITENRLFTKE